MDRKKPVPEGRYSLAHKRNSLSVWCSRRNSSDALSSTTALCPTSGIWEGLGGEIAEEEPSAAAIPSLLGTTPPSTIKSSYSITTTNTTITNLGSLNGSHPSTQNPISMDWSLRVPYTNSAAESTLNSLGWDYTVELECLNGTNDLQLAAELGKTLLERNKELENSLKHQQAHIDDQAQEIEYLNKQNIALREVNENQVKTCEQLEVSNSDLEKTNRKLVDENHADKHNLKTLSFTVECLESRCEELQRQLEQIRNEELHSLDSVHHNHTNATPNAIKNGRRRKDRRKSSSIVECLLSSEKWKRTDSEDATRVPNDPHRSLPLTERDLSSLELSHEHDLQLISELNNLRGKYDEVLERAKELEIIISKLQVENAALKTSDLEGKANEESLNAIEDDGLFHHTLTNVRDEMEDLDVVRSGKVCRTCLGPIEDFPLGELVGQAAQQISQTLRAQDDLTLSATTTNAASPTDPLHCLQVPTINLNPQFPEEVSKVPSQLLIRASSLPPFGTPTSNPPLSLQEELLMYEHQHIIEDPDCCFELDPDIKVTQTNAQTQTDAREFLRNLQEITARTEESCRHQLLSLKERFPPVDKRELPIMMSSKTNYKEIFKEIFHVLSQAQDEHE
ncbi:uncharacterized protein LOC131889833 isoform X4 [Tigriopus californicus]|uniref:uncharacterized protein LOC131889833 isoform X4 n=1 Tax=Tigriopus californicus TaxID=6832 RepID=UPI0027DA2B27|nr:uncharacterized protein LOC131889833 isoform X4 [Tigriopus californicus]